MSNDILRSGGPHQVEKTGDNQYTMRISVPTGLDGRIARECINEECMPGYFKVKPGTGIKSQTVAYCPYCRISAPPEEFKTEEQVRYARDVALDEAHGGVNRMIREALSLGSSGRRKFGGGLFSIEMSLTESSRTPPRHPLEEELRRDVICPHCGLDQSVYGLATWCADCASDIFLTHVDGEYNVVVQMLKDVPRRQEELGVRIGAKDLENCLEDLVSIFEASLKALLRRAMNGRAATLEEVDLFYRRLGNKLQNVDRACEVLLEIFNFELPSHMALENIGRWKGIFNKRHPITHNLGVIDRRYQLASSDANSEGREVRVNEEEIRVAIEFSKTALEAVHKNLVAKMDTTIR